MIRLRALITLALLASTAVASAAARLDTLADQLSRQAEALAADAYRGFSNRDRGNRSDVEALYLAVQFDASANLFRRMVQDRRPDSELRDAVDFMQSQIRSSDRFVFGRSSWRDMARTLDDIGRELQGTGRSRSDTYEPGYNRTSGRMQWRGTVDQEVQILVYGSNASLRSVAGAPVRNATFNFTSPLPTRPANVQVRKLKGRGSVELIQQPARDNGFTAVVRIQDPKGGADDYEFELAW